MLLSLTAAAVLTAQASAAERPWTLLVYGAADNNADGPILGFLDRVRKALDDDPGMDLILFIDRSEGFSDDAALLGEDFTGARIFRLRSDSAELLDADEFFPGMSEAEYEVDSADPDNVGRFVRFGKRRFPARRTGLLIYSHADGCTMCPDEESGRSMSIPELTDCVEESESVDFLALELCNMGGLEIAYQWRPGNGGFSADVLVAIPNAGPPLDWDRAFRRIRSPGHAGPLDEGRGEPPAILDPAAMTAEDFGRLVVEEGQRGRRAMIEAFPDEAPSIGYEAAACCDLSRAEAAKRAFDALAVALWESQAKDVLEGLRDGGDGRAPVLNYVGGDFADRPYVDAYALGRRAAECDRLSAGARASAREVMAAVDELVLASFGMDALEEFEPGRSGVFLVFPDGDRGAGRGPFVKRVWQELTWYTPLEGTDESAPYGRWAFLADGATAGNDRVENWYELLDAWFDDTSKSPEGLNRYRW